MAKKKGAKKRKMTVKDPLTLISEDARTYTLGLPDDVARLKALAPADLEAYARSLDFTDGGTELAAALHNRATARP
jgi:hypothetical protein